MQIRKNGVGSRPFVGSHDGDESTPIRKPNGLKATITGVLKGIVRSHSAPGQKTNFSIDLRPRATTLPKSSDTPSGVGTSNARARKTPTPPPTRTRHDSDASDVNPPYIEPDDPMARNASPFDADGGQNSTPGRRSRSNVRRDAPGVEDLTPALEAAVTAGDVVAVAELAQRHASPEHPSFMATDRAMRVALGATDETTFDGLIDAMALPALGAWRSADSNVAQALSTRALGRALRDAGAGRGGDGDDDDAQYLRPLLDHGANPQNFLRRMVATGDYEGMARLLDNGVSPNIAFKGGDTLADLIVKTIDKPGLVNRQPLAAMLAKLTSCPDYKPSERSQSWSFANAFQPLQAGRKPGEAFP